MNKPMFLLTYLILMFGTTLKTDAQWYNLFKKEVHLEDLAMKQTDEGPYFYYEGELFTGTVIHSWDKFEVKNGRLTGVVKLYEDDGTLKSQITFVDGIANGNFITYYIKGNIQEKGTYKNGNYDGAYIRYDAKGNIVEKCTYINGKIDGLSLKNWDDGSIQEKCNYIEGKIDGLYLEYHSNGQLKTSCNYNLGKYNGFYESYYEDGTVRRRGSFINNKRVGYWTHNIYKSNKYYQIEEEINNGKRTFCKTTITDYDDGRTWTRDSYPYFNDNDWWKNNY